MIVSRWRFFEGLYILYQILFYNKPFENDMWIKKSIFIYHLIKNTYYVAIKTMNSFIQKSTENNYGKKKVL